MNLPFTTEQFLHVFEQYNIGAFPVAIIFYLAALLVMFFVIQEAKPKVILYILGLMWFWMGIVYHMIYFSAINKAAYMFGAFFIAQGCLFIYYSFSKKEITFSKELNGYTFAGWLIIAYGLLVYPFLGYLNGHHYPAAPILGAPCPTAIFTFGLMLFTVRLPKLLLVIPFLWSLLGFSAALKLTIYEDFGLLISGLLTVTMVYYRDRKANVLKHSFQ